MAGGKPQQAAPSATRLLHHDFKTNSGCSRSQANNHEGPRGYPERSRKTFAAIPLDAVVHEVAELEPPLVSAAVFALSDADRRRHTLPHADTRFCGKELTEIGRERSEG